MSMLAERRKKSTYRLTPFPGVSRRLNKRTDDDTSSFGYKLMSVMGWAPGKGLGRNETGNPDPIKIRLKHDDAGIGYKVSEKDAVAQQSEFQALLLQLNSGSTTGGIESDEPKKKSQKLKIISLEKQSEQSSKRVHYKKFTRGKDLSRASEQDLRSILGLSSNNPKVIEPELKVSELDDDASAGFTRNTYSIGGSSVDYFKKKLQEKKSINNDAALKEETSLNSVEDVSNNADKSNRRSVTWGDVDVSYVDKYIKDMVDTSGSVDEMLCDSPCHEEPPTKKKKKKKNQQCSVEISEEVEGSGQLNIEKKNMKKRKFSEKENVAEEDDSVPKKKKKRKDDVLNLDPLSQAGNCEDTEALCPEEEVNPNADLSEEPKRKKKKKQKECVADLDHFSEANNCVDTEILSPGEEVNSNADLSGESKQKKKKKQKGVADHDHLSEVNNRVDNEALCPEDELNSNASEQTKQKRKKKQKAEVADLDHHSEDTNCVDIKATESLFPREEVNSSADLSEVKQKKKKKRKQVAALPEQNE